ncbi:hypothetical protein [Iodobacter fluviatilis]|uniref:Uncharacterized protein n=1 Tax=Iodobacter fluviatilis TaxID=537 RepID=A0A377Q855_9NEIS|nr:hypothetical protein [Iodobacter fluviatilis]TCU84565.1 hypothetical protein EV682_10990 [Iodobacter fluviatilis]STQ90031.1 Uncharacterised protein [Iodobacter fluviatilis]
MSTFNFEIAISIAADSLAKLKEADVFRVLESTENSNRNELALYIAKNRSDLALEVKALMVVAFCTPDWDVPQKEATSIKTDKPRTLTCCCCGNSTRGRQWWGRDNGFGLCTDCISFCEADVGQGEKTESYGIRGVHFDLQNEA